MTAKSYFFNGLPIRVFVSGAAPTTLVPGLVTDTDTIYSPTQAATDTLAPSLFDDSANDAFYVPTVTPGAVTLTPSLFSDTDTFYVPNVAQGLAPSLYDDSANDTFYAPTVTPGAVTLTPSLFSDTDTFYVPVMGQVLAPPLFSDTDTFYGPRIDQVLFPSLWRDDIQNDGPYPPTVVSADQLAPSLFVDSDTFYAPSLTNNETLSPSLFVDSDTIYPCSMQPVLPGLVTDNDTIYGPSLAPVTSLAPSLFVDTDVIYAPGGTDIDQLLGAIFIEQDTFYSPTLVFTHFLTPGLVVDADSIYAAAIVRQITPSLFVDTDTVYHPSLSQGTATIHPPLVVDTDIFWNTFIAIQKRTGGGGGGGGNTTGNVKYASKVTMPSAGLINAIGTTYTQSGAVNSRMAIYADNAGSPGALLGVTVQLTSVVIGENDYAMVTPVSVLSGQVIWIAVLTDANVGWALQSNHTGGAKYNNNLLSAGFSNPFGAASTDNKQAPVFAFFLTAANATLSPSLFVDTDTFLGGTFTENNQIVVTTDVIDTDFYYQPVLSGLYTILPNGFDDTPNDVIYAPTVAPQTAFVLPPLFSDTDVVYAPSITQPIVSALYSSDDVVYAPTLTQPFASVQPSLVTDADLIYSGVIAGSFASLTPNLFSDSDTFYAPTVTQGAIGVSPTLVTDTDAVYAPTVSFSNSVSPSLVSDSDTFYAPTIAHADVTLVPALLTDLDSFLQPSESGAFGVSASLVLDGDEVFYRPTVTPGTAFILPGFYTDDRDQFWQWAATQPDGLQVLAPSLVLDLDTFVSPDGIGKDQIIAPPLMPADDFFPPAGNVPLRHRIPVLGSDAIAVEPGVAVQGNSTNKTDVAGSDQRHVELQGEF
jgi:hypothetical protein